ncbi:MAG TPA: CoA transferase [Labilithrix sp.]|nr:CoA transferase [Labilithrix sp.]
MPEGRITGTAGGLPSVYAVDVLASATVGVATAAVAELQAARSARPARAFTVDRQHAAAAFRSERFAAPIGWELPPVWDPIAGDYAAADGWIRVHTNYAHHRDATLRALGVTATKAEVARAIALRSAEEIETAIVREGGAAAMQRTAAEWAAHPQGQAVAAEPLVLAARTPLGAGPRRVRAAAGDEAPLAGVRVLDLTRVIAGPVATRVLAGYGADVLRIDPPGFAEVGALLPETTAGKRRAALDLRSPEGRTVFEGLAAEADLLVCGYRADALERLGLGVDRLRAANPALGIVLVDAYGWSGPWRERRGFDSLVQMSTGIAARGAAAVGATKPTPLPAQALDHGAGYLVAAAACRALTDQVCSDVATVARISLARVARLLEELGTSGDPRAPELADAEPWRERAESAFGPLLRVRCPGSIEGSAPRWVRPAGPLGVDAARW